MALNRYRGNSLTTVAQAYRGTITSTTGAHTYISTVTDDQGVTHADTYTLTGSEGTVTAVGDAVVASFNANPDPYLRKLIATNNAGVITFTARTAGEPFSIALTGTGSWGSAAEFTANVGESDLGVATNWTDGYPTSSDDLVCDETSPDLLYSLNVSAVAITSFHTTPRFSGDIGRTFAGQLHRLRIDPDTITIRGSSEFIAIGIGSAAIPITVEHDRGASLDAPAVWLDGSAVTNLNVLDGNVAFAGWAGQSGTITGTITVTDDATLLLGGPLSTLTLTGAVLVASGTSETLAYQSVPTMRLNEKATVIDRSTATVTLAEVGELATLRVEAAKTITDLTLNGTLDLSIGSGAVTVTNTIVMTAKAKIIDPHRRLAANTTWQVLGGTVGRNGQSAPALDFGTNRTFRLIS